MSETTSTVTLVEFLRARLDEDEATAKAIPFEGEWSVRLEGAWQKVMAGSLPVASGADVVLPHIVRHDPARVLAEVKAGRALLRRYRAAQTNAASQPDSDFLRGRLSGYEEALKIAAFRFAYHPDYREEWRP